MVKLPVDWSTFKRAVEGLVTSSSCVIQDGLPVFNCAPVPQKPPKPHLLLLAQVLRGNQPIPRDIRIWLADMMDTEAESSFKIDLNKRGKGPKKRGGNTLHWDAARYVFLRVFHGELHKNAMVDAQKKYGISSSTLKATIADYIKAVEEHQRVSRDDP